MLHALLTLIFMLSACPLLSPGTAVAFEDPEREAWFRDAKFGLFVHWGPVSLKGTEIGWSRSW